MIALNDTCPQWLTRYEAIVAQGLAQLIGAATGKAVTHTDFIHEMVIPDARRILCVSVNFPDRNAE